MAILKIYLLGLGILIAAIALNALAQTLKLDTWYEFLREPGKTSFISYLWLFIIYPFLLGLMGYATFKVLN